MKRKLILFLTFLFSCIMLSATTIVYAAESGKETPDVFQLGIYADASLNDSQKKIDLSGIKVDVYESELTNFDSEFNISEFTHNYAFSVYTDANGGVQFVRPSKEMLILVDVSTLPRNTGIAISTKFYRNDIIQDKLAISKVDRVVIEKAENSEDDFYVNAYNKEGIRLNVDYILSEKSSLNLENEKIVCMEACVGEITTTFEFVTPIINMKTIEIQDLECEESLEQERSSETQDFKPEDFNQNKRFGHFLICYNSSSNVTPPFITSLASALQEADTSLVGNLALNRPTSNVEGTQEYHVFVIDYVELIDASAYCKPYIDGSGNRTSFIVVQDITDLSTELTLLQKGMAAHEYMHAITHTYRNIADLPNWFAEAWADWAAVRVQGINSRGVDNVNLFLNNSYKAFKTDEYKYGKFLLPLFIGQNYGGDITVANVIKNLATTNNVEVAISNALPTGKTFQSIFPDFMGYNYSPRYFYSTYAEGWSRRPFISESYSINGYPNDAYGGNINSYATHYREFSVPLTAPYHIDITIRLLNNNGSLSGKLHMNGSGNMATSWGFSTESSLVTYSTTIGISYIKGGMSITNTGSSPTSYHITIARS